MATSYRQLTPRLKHDIIECFQNGMECRDIPAHLDVSQRSVSRILLEAGINTKRRNRYTLNENYFDNIDSQQKAYFLGLMAADGCVTTSNYVVYESVSSSLVEQLKAALQYTGDIRTVEFSKGYAPHYRINFSSKQIADSLRNYAVFAGRTEAGAFYFPNDRYLGSYLLGYFDGDGCAYVNKGRSGGLVCIASSMAWANALVKRLNMGHILIHQSQSVCYWRIYSRTDIQNFHDLIYQVHNLGLQYKKDKIEEILGSYRRG